MNEEILQEIKRTINANKDYKEHYRLNVYFEVEYIDKLVTAYEQLQKQNTELKEENKNLQCEREYLFKTIHNFQKTIKKLKNKEE